MPTIQRTNFSSSRYRGGRRGLTGDPTGRFRSRGDIYRQLRRSLGLSAG